jgi:hypothetical protein
MAMLILRENRRYDVQQQQQQQQQQQKQQHRQQQKQGTNQLDGGVQAMLRRRQVVSPALHARDDD